MLCGGVAACRSVLCVLFTVLSILIQLYRYQNARYNDKNSFDLLYQMLYKPPKIHSNSAGRHYLGAFFFTCILLLVSFS